MVFALSAFWWIRIGGLRKLPDGRDWLWGKLGLTLMGGAMLSKPLTQVFCWRGGVVFLLCSLAWGQIMIGVIVVMVTSFKRTYTSMCGSQDCCIQCHWPCGRPLSPTHLPETPGHSQESLAQSFVRSLLLFPGSWCSQVLFVPFKSLFPQSCGISSNPTGLQDQIPWGSKSFCQISGLGNLLWALELLLHPKNLFV